MKRQQSRRGGGRRGLVIAVAVSAVFLTLLHFSWTLSGAGTVGNSAESTIVEKAADLLASFSRNEHAYIGTKSVVRTPRKHLKGSQHEFRTLSLEERVHLLEVKTNAHLGWITDPRIGVRRVAKCKNPREIAEHKICLDNLKPNECIVYDIGVREQPEFGVIMANEYGCEVHAFDPSPISVKFFDDGTFEKEGGLKKGLWNTKYFFHPYGGGGVDGDIELFKYNWGQVSTLFFNRHMSRTPDEKGKWHSVDPRYSRDYLPVRTLRQMMYERGHDSVDVLKLDMEGSEYAFLESAIDHFGCLPVDQITTEVHFHTFDNRYLGGASPEINAIAACLRECGMLLWDRDYSDGGFPDPASKLAEMGLKMYFNTISFARGLEPIQRPGS